jgi:hypothetical protein
MIKQHAEINTETLTQVITKEYKIYKLMPEGGSQEIDFVEWASNLNNKHPIAKAYQDLRKSHFKKLRKE